MDKLKSDLLRKVEREQYISNFKADLIKNNINPLLVRINNSCREYGFKYSLNDGDNHNPSVRIWFILINAKPAPIQTGKIPNSINVIWSACGVRVEGVNCKK